MSIIVPWVLFGLAALGIGIYGARGWGKRHSRSGQGHERANPRKAA
jgi:hypothetical protein